MPKGIPGSGKAARKAQAAGGSVDAAIRAMIQAELPGAIQAFFAKGAGNGSADPA